MKLATSDNLGYDVLKALGITAPVTALSLNFHAGDYVTATVEFYVDEEQGKAIQRLIKDYHLVEKIKPESTP